MNKYLLALALLATGVNQLNAVGHNGGGIQKIYSDTKISKDDQALASVQAYVNTVQGSDRAHLENLLQETNLERNLFSDKVHKFRRYLNNPDNADYLSTFLIPHAFVRYGSRNCTTLNIVTYIINKSKDLKPNHTVMMHHNNHATYLQKPAVMNEDSEKPAPSNDSTSSRNRVLGKMQSNEA